MINGLDLFSGIAGIGLALEPWVRTVAYCERDPYAQAVLLSRMREGKLPSAPIWDDVQTLSGSDLPPIDIIFGGFPCQDISVAGNGKGLEGERSGLFFQIVRLASELRPRFIFLENVPAITLRGLERVCMELTKMGYDLRWTVISAASIGAPHMRERWFLLAHDNGTGLREQSNTDSRGNGKTELANDGAPKPMANPDGDGKQSSSEGWNAKRNGIGNGREELGNPERARLEGYGEEPREEEKPKSGNTSSPASSREWWATEPEFCRVVDGLSAELDAIERCINDPKSISKDVDHLVEAALKKTTRIERIKCLGNAVVPLQAREAFKRLMGL